MLHYHQQLSKSNLSFAPEVEINDVNLNFNLIALHKMSQVWNITHKTYIITWINATNIVQKPAQRTTGFQISQFNLKYTASIKQIQLRLPPLWTLLNLDGTFRPSRIKTFLPHPPLSTFFCGTRQYHWIKSWPKLTNKFQKHYQV